MIKCNRKKMSIDKHLKEKEKLLKEKEKLSTKKYLTLLLTIVYVARMIATNGKSGIGWFIIGLILIW